MTKREIVILGKTLDWEKSLKEPLLNEKIFTCPDCGEKCSYNELEIWSTDTVDDIVNDKVSCSICYEIEMGEDL